MIDTDFLQDVAEFVNGKVAKVVLNGAYEITEFETKQVSGNVLQMKYMVPYGSVPNISQIELKNIDGFLISTNTVDVPVTADTILFQMIVVKEEV
ncbi:ketopantoate hydroxymethyltransferase [Desulforamulus ruminis]|uniref:ketopantoate hydroxymethyltransferase n=1 Tax=Desulforamulus ruminis TaxID=1564 RepID=UPI0023545C72|nr:ketopantoate hydroxymethyltransferase [Desulforamulus ruminis]